MRSVKNIICLVFVLAPIWLTGQSIADKLNAIDKELAALDKQREDLLSQREQILFQKIQADLISVGLPSTDYISHDAMFISYNEEHEQANWVAHVILEDIRRGGYGRGNELFVPDPKIKTGSTVEEDYFLKTKINDDDYEYDGYGYDRGHLAPAADFRWSRTAVDSSFYYSNMSPQLPEFNREIWGELEAALRDYVILHEAPLVVFTLPIFHDDKKVSPRSVNEVSVPKGFIKVALDQKHQRGMAVYLPHAGSDEPLSTFAITIDEAEAMSGFDFFNNLPSTLQSTIESTTEADIWFPELDAGEYAPLDMEALPPGHVNTSSVRYHAGTKAKVCGHAVSVYQTSSDNIFINLDRKYPNQSFSILIPKSKIKHFSYDLEKRFLNQKMCATGRVYLLKENTAQVTISTANQVELMDD